MNIPRQLHEWMDLAIDHDYLLSFLITSEAEASLPSLGLPYGAGKSTLGWSLSHSRYRREVSSDVKAWDLVFDHAHYYPHEIEAAIQPGHPRASVRLWDDIQETCPMSKSNSPDIIQLGADLTTSRTELAVLIGTGSDLGMIAAPIRRFMKFELIIPVRGKFEFHKIRKIKDYDDPYWNKADMRIQTVGTFDPLPPDIQERYVKWRTDKRKLGGGDTSDKRAREILKKLFPEDIDLLGRIFKEGSMMQNSIKQFLATKPETSNGDGPTWNAFMKRLYRLGCISTEGGALIVTPRGRLVLEIKDMGKEEKASDEYEKIPIPR